MGHSSWATPASGVSILLGSRLRQFTRRFRVHPNNRPTNQSLYLSSEPLAMSGVVGNAARTVIKTPRSFPKQTMKPPNPDDVASALRKLLPKELPASLDTSRPGNLYQVLSRHPDSGVGRRVTQCRWGPKQIEGSYWLVTRAQFKLEGKHGKAWGKLYWKGTCCHLLLHIHGAVLIRI